MTGVAKGGQGVDKPEGKLAFQFCFKLGQEIRVGGQKGGVVGGGTGFRQEFGAEVFDLG